MQPIVQPQSSSPLDPAKLFGFRNLARVTAPESDVHISADLVFTKRGTEAAGA